MRGTKSFYVTLESDLLFDERINSTTKILYAVISTYSNNEKGYCYLNHKQLMNIIKIKSRQFYYCLNDLKKYNYVTLKKINNRSYLMPVINVLPELRENNNEAFSKLFDYDWLNDKKN